MIYQVYAYRWGYLNSHRYHVWTGIKLSDAVYYAGRECLDRAGKYGVAIWELDGERKDLKEYYPSILSEDVPRWCDTISSNGAIGYKIRNLLDESKAGVFHRKSLQEIINNQDELYAAIAVTKNQNKVWP